MGVHRADGAGGPDEQRAADAFRVGFVAFAALVVLLTAVVLSRFQPTVVHVPTFGLYAGPGANGVSAAMTFARTTGAPIEQLLDFASADSWDGITGPAWLLRPHENSGLGLEYALPMFPEVGGTSLQSCADGDYDQHWAQLAQNLSAAHLGDAIVRPGWEFNGDWYSWAAKGRTSQYIGCFRRIVDAMRAVPGQDFRFDWNPALGDQEMPAERAYPGDAYVDYVGVDAYDSASWSQVLHGAHGLAFWSSFAASHGKPLAIPEWGVVGGDDGRGDDPAYISHMFQFMTDSAHHVAYQQYFDVRSSVASHALGVGTEFPRSRKEFISWVHKLS